MTIITDTYNPTFSLFESGQRRKGRRGTQFTATELRVLMTSTVYKSQTENLRELYQYDKPAYDKAKRKLPVLICSQNGHGSKKEFLKGRAKWNGLISLDLDLEKNGRILMIRDEALARIKACPFVYMALPSVSNNGYGLFIRITGMPNCDEARDMIFTQINHEYFDNKLDPGRKDISGCRFIAHCHENEIYVNPDADTFTCEGIPQLTEYELQRVLYPLMAEFEDLQDSCNNLERGEWRRDGLYGTKAVSKAATENTAKHTPDKLVATKTTLPEYSYMGQPYGTLLLPKTAPKKEHTVRNPDINPNAATLVKCRHKQNSKTKHRSHVPAHVASVSFQDQNSGSSKLYKTSASQIHPGQRNTYLTSLKGFLSYSGHSASECAIKLYEANKQFPHPLSEQEVNSVTYYQNSRSLNPKFYASPTQPLTPREYTVDTQLRLDFATAWNSWTLKTKRIIKTGNPQDILETIDIAYAFAKDHPEWEFMFKSFHALTCAIGKRFAFERYTWEDDPDGTEWRNRINEDAYLNLNPQEIRHAEVNKTRTVVQKSIHVHSLDSNKVNVKTQDSYNRAYVGYKLVDVESMSLSDLITLLVFLEGDHWNVTNKYVGDVSCLAGITSTLPSRKKVLTILMKCRTVDRRNEWYLAKLRKQWDESVLLIYSPELLAADNT